MKKIALLMQLFIAAVLFSSTAFAHDSDWGRRGHDWGHHRGHHAWRQYYGHRGWGGGHRVVVNNYYQRPPAYYQPRSDYFPPQSHYNYGGRFNGNWPH